MQQSKYIGLIYDADKNLRCGDNENKKEINCYWQSGKYKGKENLIMEEAKRERSNFVGYEYKDVTARNDMVALWSDSMVSFGWELEESTASIVQGINTVNLKFKRDRKIRNKAELTRLQRQFEASVREIETLEKSKTMNASIFAFTFGIIGTAFMAGSVFTYIGDMLLPSIILAIPGFIGWILPYFCYVKLKDKKTASVTPLIDHQYDMIYETCEKASSLLSE